MDNTREKLIELLANYFDIGDSYAYNLTRVKSAFACGTMGFDDFEEFDDETVADIADHLIANGVTVQKWIPVTERLPEKGVLVLCIGARGGMFLGNSPNLFSDGTAYFCVPNARSCRYATHWMPLPEPPKGD